MNVLNVLYTIDSNYFNHFLISLVSLLENNQDKNFINIYLIQESLKLEQLEKLNAIKNQYNNLILKIYNASDIYEQLKNYNLSSYRNSFIPMLRLFYSLVIEDVDYLLYLDADTIVVDKIDLNDLNFSNTILACKDHIQASYKSKLSIAVNHYYNSGVLFIDHETFKKKNCLEAILNTIKNHRTLLFPDQDILNMALNEHIDSLPLNYNLFSTDVYFKKINSLFYKRYEIFDFYSKSEIKEAIQKPIILHTTDLYGIRPWHKNTVHPYNEIYDYYMQKIFGYIEKEDVNPEYGKLLFRLHTTGEIFKNLILKK